MKYIINYILKILAVCLASIFLGAIALLAVYCLPTKSMYRHLQQDRQMIQQEGQHWSWGKISATSLDGFTDSIMLMNAVYPVEKANLNAMIVPRWFVEKESPDVTLAKALESKEAAEKISDTDYSIYWHGYLVYLKPMLLVSSYHTVRILNAYLQLFLIGFLLLALYQRLGILHAMAFFLTICFINPITTAMSMQLSSIFYIILLSVAGMLCRNDLLYERNWYRYFFLIIGIVTAYMDFLTYPIVGLGIPLLVYVLLNKRELSRIGGGVLPVVENICTWGTGYVLMWSGKCLAAWVVSGQLILEKFVGAAKYRSSSDVGFDLAGHEPVNFFTVLQANLKAATEGPWIWLFAAFAIYLAYRAIRKGSFRVSLRILPALVLAGSLPLLWYFAMQNHSYVHAGFLAYRDLAILFFAVLCIGIEAGSDTRLE